MIFIKHLKEQRKQHLTEVCSIIQQSTVDEAVDKMKYLWACDHADGCHFAHLL